MPESAQESTLSTWAGPYVTDMMGKASALASQPYQSYTGPLTAGASDLQSDAFAGIAGLTLPTADQTTYNPGTFTSTLTPFTQNNYTSSQTPYAAGTFTSGLNPFTSGTYSGTADPYTATSWQDSAVGAGTDPFTARSYTDTGVAQQYMNPYIMQSLSPQLQEAQRQAEAQRLADSARLTRAGAYGGSRQALMESEGNRNLMQNMSNITGTGLDRAYNTGMGQFNVEEGRRWEQYDADIQRLMGQYNIDEGRAMELYKYNDTSGRNQYNTEQRLGFDVNKYDRDAERDQWNMDTDNARDQWNTTEDRNLNIFDTKEAARRAQYNTDYSNELNQFNTEEDQLMQATQNDRAYGLDALTQMMDMGAVQRGIDSEGVAADYAQFKDQRDFPYRQVQYLQSMLQGLPLQTNSYSYQQPSPYSEFSSASGSLLTLLNNLLGGGGTSGGTG